MATLAVIATADQSGIAKASRETAELRDTDASASIRQLKQVHSDPSSLMAVGRRRLTILPAGVGEILCSESVPVGQGIPSGHRLILRLY